MTDLDFVHRYTPPAAPGAPTLLLLHGTGGNEDDLVPLAESLAPGAGVLSPRGKVLENGMPRFFRRLAEGVFDLEDLRRRTRELAEFVETARVRYGIADPPVAVGFSNGANIAAALLLLRPEVLSSALLFRPMVPLVPDRTGGLDGVRVAIVSARQDPIVPPEQPEELAELLRRAGAEVVLHWIAGGHGLTRQDVAVGREWFGFSSLSGAAERVQW